MKNLFLVTLFIAPLAHAMESAVIQEKSPETLAQENVGELSRLIDDMKSLNKLVWMIRKWTPFNHDTCEKWKAVSAALLAINNVDIQFKRSAAQTISNISCLSVTLTQSLDLVKATKGSELALKIFREEASEGLAKLASSRETLQALTINGAKVLLEQQAYLTGVVNLKKDDETAHTFSEGFQAANSVCNRASLAQPLITLIEAVNNLVNPGIELMKKDDKADIARGITLLTDSARIVSSIALQATKASSK